MSLTVAFKKLSDLNEKDKKIHDFYDPTNVHKVQHPHILDLRNDYKEDVQNYGFARFGYQDGKNNQFGDRDKRIQSATVQINNKILTPIGNIQGYREIKPLSSTVSSATARKSTGQGIVTFNNQLNNPNSFEGQSRLVRKSITSQKYQSEATAQSQSQITITSPRTFQSVQYVNSHRPNTAAIPFSQDNVQLSRNIQSASQNQIQLGYESLNDKQITLEEQENDQNNQQEHENNNGGPETIKRVKHWKFTKKYDTNGKQAVRNQSALKKIVMDGLNQQTEELQDDDELQQIHERAMENRLNGQKIFITKDGEVIGSKENKEESEANTQRKYSPNEREKLYFYDSFQSQRVFLSKGDIQFKKVYTRQPLLQQSLDSYSSRRMSTNGNEHDRDTQKGTSQVQSVKFQSSSSIKASRKLQERPQTAAGFFSSVPSMKSNVNKEQNIQPKKKTNSRPHSANSETIQQFMEDDQKQFNLKKIQSAVLHPDGPNKFYADQDYKPLQLTEWNFANQCNKIFAQQYLQHVFKFSFHFNKCFL